MIHVKYRLPMLVALLMLAGCPQPQPPQQQKESPLDGGSLKLTVIDDPEMAAAIEQLRGEWTAQTGTDFQVRQISGRQLPQRQESDDLAADAIIYPSHMLGTLAQRNLLSPLPKESLQSDDWAGVFELLRTREAAWGSQTVAVPFGSPVLVCYYRADLLKKLGRQPPRTWGEYQQIAELLAEQGPEEEWSGTIEPLAPGWAGLTLLARAAPYAKHRENYSTLFNIETMKPLISGEPMVRALDELVAAAKLGSLDHDPSSAREAFWQGRCAMALSWPTSAEIIELIDENVEVGFIELPGSVDVYNVARQSWERRWQGEDRHVPLLAVAGRIGSVCDGSSRKAAARQLLYWLSGNQRGRQVCAASLSTTLFRDSQAEFPGDWVETPVQPLAAVKYAAITKETLSREQWLLALRLPGRGEYLRALDNAVRSTVSGEQTSEEALGEVAQAWREITERLGVDTQRRAYLHSLGLW
ncbi:MAG: extracellular solute-binding protein [Thermoguttaceae bacterium]